MPLILVVDDDDDIRDSVADLLRMHGFDVAGAGDGVEALACLRGTSRPVALILLDLMMPHMDGCTFRRQQLADPKLASIPVVVLSAVTDAPEIASCAPFAEVLTKPIELDTLLAAVERHART